MKERELLKKAIEALEEIHVGNMTPMAEANWNKAITAIKEALAQPEQEPVAWYHPEDYKTHFTTGPSQDMIENGYWQPLYKKGAL